MKSFYYPLILTLVSCTTLNSPKYGVDDYDFGHVRTSYWYTDGDLGLVVASDYDLECDDYSDGINGLVSGDEFGIIYFVTDDLDEGNYFMGESPSLYTETDVYAVDSNLNVNWISFEDSMDSLISLHVIDSTNLEGWFYVWPDHSGAYEEIDDFLEAEFCESLAMTFTRLLIQ